MRNTDLGSSRGEIQIQIFKFQVRNDFHDRCIGLIFQERYLFKHIYFP